MLEGDAGELRGNFSDRGAPELRDFKHVGLVDAGDLVAALGGELKGDAGDADDLVLCVTHGVPGFARGLVPLAWLAEVEAAEEFANEENVSAIDDLRAQGGIDGELFEGEGWAQIGEAAERGAQLQEAGLRAFVGRERIELVAADGAEENGV